MIKLIFFPFQIQLAFLGEKSNEIYEVGSILKLYNAQYRNINGASLSIKSFTTVVEVKPLLKLADNKQESVLTSSDAEFEKEDQSKLSFSKFRRVKNN